MLVEKSDFTWRKKPPEHKYSVLFLESLKKQVGVSISIPAIFTLSNKNSCVGIIDDEKNSGFYQFVLY